mmetsp:Transcript_28628/g.31794  ORF Transcript_28628/g.31794 Transcript_28628/m.31794 type:complete len:154 (+) Transcript_28628:2-463(+)
MKLLLALALVFAVAFCAKPLSWTKCDSGATFDVSQVTMTPYPAIAGKAVTVHAHGMENKTYSNGDWDTTVYLDGLPVKKFTGSICNPPIIPDCPCPCPVGPHTTALTVEIPSFAITSDGYSGQFTAYDQDKHLILCIKYNFSIENKGVSAIEQ